MVKNWIEKNAYNIFMAPTILFILLMVMFPLLFTLYLSFTEWSMGTTAPRFIGLENYINLIRDERFINATGRTLFLAFGSVAIQLVLGTALAVFLNRNFKGKNLVKTLFLLPMVVTPVAIGMVWLLIYEPTLGIANHLLKSIGLDPVLWLVDRRIVLYSLMLIEVWEWTPMITLIVLAGLTAVPTDPVESAMVDGANRWQIFWKVTFPMLRPTLVIAALLRLIDALKTFDIIYSTTAGGPLFASETLNILAYTTSFSYFQMGRGSATIVLFLVVIGFASSLMIWVRRKVGIDL
jgi:multiple sugar transport system permease protein